MIWMRLFGLCMELEDADRGKLYQKCLTLTRPRVTLYKNKVKKTHKTESMQAHICRTENIKKTTRYQLSFVVKH